MDVNMMDIQANLTDFQQRITALNKQIDVYNENQDSFFLVINGIICFLMQGGFALLECGAVRAKNATNILLKNVLDSFIGAFAYWIVGFPLAYGDGNDFSGVKYWAWKEFDISLAGFWWFQFVFAATTATIVSGSLAERCDFIAYLIYSFVLTGFLYPVVSHWAWSPQGWLSIGHNYTIGNEIFHVTYQDFAGSGAVHALSGVVAFTGAAILGPRIGRFRDTDVAPEIRGHSVPFAALGAFILFFGFFAFNGGSLGSISGEGNGIIVSIAVVNTMISGAFGAVVTLVSYAIYTSCTENTTKFSLLNTINGGLTGMVTVCSGANVYHPWASAVAGAIGGATYLTWSHLMVRFKIDDPLDAIAVHAGGGFAGILLAPVLARDVGLVYKWDVHSGMQLGYNALGVLAIAAWSALVGGLTFGLLNLFGLFRVDPKIELAGLDVNKHGEKAYPADSYGDGWSNVPQPLEASALTMEITEGRRASIALDQGRISPVRRRSSIDPDRLAAIKEDVVNRRASITF